MRALRCGANDVASLGDACTMSEVALGDRCEPSQLYQPCSYFVTETGDPGLPERLCTAQCVALENVYWDVQCHDCGRTCAPPGPNSVVTELDTSDCPDRLFPVCMPGATDQERFDNMLASLVGGPPSVLADLFETSLQVEVRDGCVTRFYVRNAPLEAQQNVARVLGPVLAKTRYDCAEQLSCGHVVGPSTLATQ